MTGQPGPPTLSPPKSPKLPIPSSLIPGALRTPSLLPFQKLLPPHRLKSPEWSAWLMLHGLLEDFAGHLLKPAWVQVCGWVRQEAVQNVWIIHRPNLLGFML